MKILYDGRKINTEVTKKLPYTKFFRVGKTDNALLHRSVLLKGLTQNVCMHV